MSWCEKKRIFQPTIKSAFATKSEMIIPNSFSEEYLFQIIRIENEESTRIIVQTVAMTEFDGAHSGRSIVFCHKLPVLAKYETAEAVMIARRGMKKKFGLIRGKSSYPKIIYWLRNKNRISF